MYKNLLKVTFSLLCLSLSIGASATIVYSYERNGSTLGGWSGLAYESVAASFETGTNEFSFTVDYDGATPDGGWLVISPGPNPKGESTSELGIAYFDAVSNDVWVYAYDGANGPSSYQHTELLEFFDNGYTADPTDSSIVTLSFNATAINDVLETGFEFGRRIGIWYHPANNVSIQGDSQGISNFYASGVGWLDTNFDGNCNNQNTGCITAIPEPSSLALLGLGLGIIGLRKRLA